MYVCIVVDKDIILNHETHYFNKKRRIVRNCGEERKTVFYIYICREREREGGVHSPHFY